MATHADWRSLMSSVGIGTSPTIFDRTVTNPYTFNLPPELRTQIYADLCDGLTPTLHHRGGGRLHVRLHRTKAHANLLLTCKTIYLDAVCVPFTHQRFEITLEPAGDGDDSNYGDRLDARSSDLVLGMPSHIHISVSLRKTYDFVVHMLRLQSILKARQGNARKSEVNLCLDAVPVKQKAPIVRSLHRFIGGLDCDVVVSGMRDVRRVEKEEEKLQAALQHYEWWEVMASSGPASNTDQYPGLTFPTRC